MTYRHKLARRLALIRDHAVLAAVAAAAACSTDGGLTGSGFDPLDSNAQIVRLIASSDNPTITRPGLRSAPSGSRRTAGARR